MNKIIEATEVEPEVFINDYNIMDAFDELSFTEKWKKVSEGLKQSPETGAYKWARFQQKRLMAPAAAVIGPIILILIVSFLAAIQPPQQPSIAVSVIESAAYAGVFIEPVFNSKPEAADNLNPVTPDE